MTTTPKFPSGKASLSRAMPSLDDACADAHRPDRPCPQGPRQDRDGGMSCFVLDKASGKNLSWRSSLWGSPSRVCLPISTNLPAATRRRPLVLMSEGIGITPMIAMARFLMEQAHRQVDVHFIHESQGDREAPFLPDMLAWDLSPHFSLHLRQPFPRGPLHNPMSHGRVDADFLRSLTLPKGADCYVCGSEAFTERSRDALESLGIAADHIHIASISPAPAAPSHGTPFLEKLDQERAAISARNAAQKKKRETSPRPGILAFFFAPLFTARRMKRT